MCILCVLEWILFSGKEGQKYFFSLALNNDKFLYENEYKAFDIYEIEKQRFGPVFSWSVLSMKGFLKSFSSSFSFSNLLFMF